MCAPGINNHIQSHTITGFCNALTRNVINQLVHGPGRQPASGVQPAVDGRANFMHGSYKYGPVELTVTGVGFGKEGLDGIDPALTQTFR